MTRHRPVLCVLALFFGIVWHGSAQAETLRYYVTLDQARVLPMPEAVTKVSLANPAIADVMVLSLTTAKGIQDFALNKEQALLIAKTMRETANQLAKPKS